MWYTADGRTYERYSLLIFCMKTRGSMTQIGTDVRKDCCIFFFRGLKKVSAVSAYNDGRQMNISVILLASTVGQETMKNSSVACTVT